MRVLPAAAATVFIAACGRTPSPVIVFVGEPVLTSVEIHGLPSSDLAALSGASLTPEQWQEILRVQVAGPGAVPIAGRYSAESGLIRYTPMYGFDRGRSFDVILDPSRIPGARGEGWRKAQRSRFIGIVDPASAPTTTVRHVYPSASTLPENMLRFYIEFSGPMGRGSALEHIHLVEDGGNEVVEPFLPVEAEFWNPERTRFTLFFDPGRVKQGIKPNRDMGRALVQGKRYALVISDRWLDGRGQPLKEEYRHAFTAGPAEAAALDTATWKIGAPSAGTRDPLTVTFSKPLDIGLLQRAVGVQRKGLGARGLGLGVPGEVRIDGAETRWAFIPRDPWTAGDYTLVVLTLLEDPSGNRIGRAFEAKGAEGEKRAAIEVAFRVPGRR